MQFDIYAEALGTCSADIAAIGGNEEVDVSRWPVKAKKRTKKQLLKHEKRAAAATSEAQALFEQTLQHRDEGDFEFGLACLARASFLADAI